MDTARPAVVKEGIDFVNGSYQNWMKILLEEDPGFVKDVLGGPGRYELLSKLARSRSIV